MNNEWNICETGHLIQKQQHIFHLPTCDRIKYDLGLRNNIFNPIYARLTK